MTRDRIGRRSSRYSPPASSTFAWTGTAPRYATAAGAASASARTKRAVTPSASASAAARVARRRKGRIMWGRRGEGEGAFKRKLYVIGEDRVAREAAQADRPGHPVTGRTPGLALHARAAVPGGRSPRGPGRRAPPSTTPGSAGIR